MRRSRLSKLFLRLVGVLALGAAPALAQTPADTLRFRALLNESKRRPMSDTAQQRRILAEALLHCQRSGYAFGEGVASNGLAYVAALRTDSVAHRRHLLHARQVLERLYQRAPTPAVGREIAVNLNNQANDLQLKGDNKGAAQVLIKATEYFEQIGESRLLVVTYYNLGGLLHSMDQYDRAIHYWERALALRPQAPGAPMLLVVATSLADHYINHKQLPQARRYLAQARELLTQFPGNEYRSQYLNAQGRYELAAGHPQPGVALLEQGLALARQHGDLAVVVSVLPDVAEGHQQLGHYAQARTYLLESMRLSHLVGEIDNTVELEDLAAIEEKLHHPAQALAYYRRFHALHDSLNNVEVKTQINGLETQYQTREKEQRIRLLQQNQRLQAAELRRQHQLTYGAFALVAALLGAGGLGYAALRNRRQLEQQQQLLQARKIQELEQERQLTATEAMLRGQEEERGRLARDLHDGLGGMLSTVKLYLGSVRGNVVLPEASAQLFARSLEHLDGSISELRRVARDMMPEALLQFGLVPALRDICEALGHREQLQVQLQAYGLDERLPQRTEVVVYRLAQELLTNVLRHAQARQVLVQLIRTGPHVQLVVEDDGQGFDPATVRGGVGLRSIQARVDYLRGTLDIQSTKGQGTTTTIDFYLAPVPVSAAASELVTAQ